MRIVDKKPFVGCSTRPLSSTWYNNNSNNIRPLLFSRDPAQSKVQLRQKRAPAAWMPSHNGNMTVAMDAARLVTNIRVISGSNQVQFIIGSLHFSAAYLVIYQSRTSSSSAQIFRRLLTAKWRHSLQQLFHFPSQHTRRLASVPRGIIGINLLSLPVNDIEISHTTSVRIRIWFPLRKIAFHAPHFNKTRQWRGVVQSK